MGQYRQVMSLPEVDSPETREFWEGCRQGQLKLPHCRQCGRYHWYPLPVCPHCQSELLEWSAVSGRARIFTWTEVRHPFSPQAAEVLPVLIALVTPEEAPEIRLVTNVLDCQEADLEIGMPVKVVFEQVSANITMPFFRLVEAV